MKKTAGNFGFSLVELMVVIAIIGVMTMAVGSMLPWQRSNAQFRDFSRTMVTDVQLSKMTAIKHNANVVVDLPAGGGYRIFVDDGGGVPAAANNDSFDANEQVIRTAARPDNVILTDVGGNILTFLPTGLLKNSPVQIDISNNQINRKASLRVTLTGLIRFENIED